MSINTFVALPDEYKDVDIKNITLTSNEIDYELKRRLYDFD